MSDKILENDEFNVDETFFLELDEKDEEYKIENYEKIPDILKIYYSEASKYPLLTAGEEKELGIVLKNVQDCVLLDKNSVNKNELDYDLVIKNFISYKDNPEVLLLMKKIIKFINIKNNPKITVISNILNSCQTNLEIMEFCTPLKLNDFKNGLKIYLNYLKAKEKMINSNLRLVISFAKKYSSYKTSLSDLINEGNIGLIMATENFDVDKGFRFSTYAMFWIKQFVIRYLYLNSVDISVTEGKLRDALNFRKKVEELEKKTGKMYSYYELAAILNVEYKKIVEYMYINPSISLDKPLTSEDDDTTLQDVVSKESDSVEEYIFSTNLKKDIECLFENLTDKEKQIIALRFGFSNKEKDTYTLEAIGMMYHVSKERIRAIEAKALKKMRKSIERNPEARQLKYYLTN